MSRTFAGAETAAPATTAGGGRFDLRDDRAYGAWREEKLARYPRTADELLVEVADMQAPTAAEAEAIRATCRRANMALYRATVSSRREGNDAGVRRDIRAFASTFGLGAMESHRSAEEDGIVAIEVTETETKRGFIPYTTKALSWHTDGYYNAADEAIQGMLLHCARPAQSGGANALLDHDIVYIRLRDADPALVAAMMHPEAMSIPPSQEEDGSIRPLSTGPVFFVDPATGGLTMRYTARTRNITWRDDEDTRAAVSMIDRLLAKGEEPLILTYRMEAGEGLISNNVLHTRTAFENDDETGRLLYRVRYRERIAGT